MTNKPLRLESVKLADVESARRRLAGLPLCAPMVRLDFDCPNVEIFLKLECLQPIRSFKIRGAGNAMAAARAELVAEGVSTASAGNMAQGVAWHAQRLRVPCSVYVPDNAPETKLAAIARLGGSIVRVSHSDWWQILEAGGDLGQEGLFVHPVEDREVIAGNGTVGLEIAEELPDADAVIVPYGGGGLACGIAIAMRAVMPGIQIYVAEPETAAGFATAMQSGGPVDADFEYSFIDGAGSRRVLTGIWPLVSRLVDKCITVSVAQVASALRLLIERNAVVAEGAGALSVAAAINGKLRKPSARKLKVVCVVTGGNIDPADVATVLNGGIPKR
ncbi:MAG: pyridoxal-phosphate dependent enzyme [Proteobacteria bacterium]|nr:pyridoxal-phosphate dependent enzyme [Pseudomonadota bacterium]